MLVASSSSGQGEGEGEVSVSGERQLSNTRPIARTDVAFRVHRGVLARQSEVFREMLDIPQPDFCAPDIQSESRIEGCEVVRMYDHPIELASLLKAIYDGL